MSDFAPGDGGSNGGEASVGGVFMARSLDSAVRMKPSADKPVDVLQMRKDSLNPRNPDAFECSQKLEAMCVVFFEKLNVPINMQLPVLFFQTLNWKPLLVMKGLLMNDAIKAAFAKVPEIDVFTLPGRFLPEVQMSVEFFERTVRGEVGNVAAETSAKAGGVIEA
ncbi:MAG: hypothetical protein Q8P62_04750 [Candidatus Peregrinibacteria bacterium]|nr:hypothetical protein [Candidatus Peregrinibacteria bacterium]